MRRFFNITLIVVLFIISFIFLNKLVAPKYQTNLVEGHMISEFYDEKMVHDVIFIGDCEVYANFSPMVLYKNYGITSYIRGTSQQLIWQSYGILKETLKYEIPKVVVLNVNSLRYDKPVSEAYNHLTLDKMKWSKEKLEIIEASMLDEENIFDYLFPIVRYHSRFSTLTNEDFEYLVKENKVTHNGFLINKRVKPVTNLPTKKVLGSYKFKDNSLSYLDKIRKLCEDNNIKLVLIKAPSLYPYWYDEYEEQIIEYTKKYNLDYYNFTKVTEEIGIDYQTDTYDGGLHLNLYGAEKLSTYFGDILKSNYDLTDYRLDNDVSSIYNEKLLKYNSAIRK